MTAPEPPEAFGPVLPACEGQRGPETCSGRNGLPGLEEWHCKLEHHHVQQKLFLGDFPDYIVSLVSLSYVVSHEPRKRRGKKHDIKQNEYPPIRQYFV